MVNMQVYTLFICKKSLILNKINDFKENKNNRCNIFQRIKYTNMLSTDISITHALV